jgi:hypothetical protein
VLWCLRHDSNLVEADLLSSDHGVALQVFVNDKLTADVQFATGSQAVRCANGLRAYWEDRGWLACWTSELPDGGVPLAN